MEECQIVRKVFHRAWTVLAGWDCNLVCIEMPGYTILHLATALHPASCTQALLHKKVVQNFTVVTKTPIEVIFHHVTRSVWGVLWLYIALLKNTHQERFLFKYPSVYNSPETHTLKWYHPWMITLDTMPPNKYIVCLYSYMCSLYIKNTLNNILVGFGSLICEIYIPLLIYNKKYRTFQRCQINFCSTC